MNICELIYLKIIKIDIPMRRSVERSAIASNADWRLAGRECHEQSPAAKQTGHVNSQFLLKIRLRIERKQILGELSSLH